MVEGVQQGPVLVRTFFTLHTLAPPLPPVRGCTHKPRGLEL